MPNADAVHGRDLSPIATMDAHAALAAVPAQAGPRQQLAAWLAALEASLLPLHCLGQSLLDMNMATLLSSLMTQRSIWMPPAGDARLIWPLLQEIGAAMLPLKVVLPYQADIGWRDWCELPGWWIAAPSTCDEARDCLLRSVSDDWPAIIILPEHWQRIPGCQHFEWGRLCADPDEPVWLLCAPEAVATGLECQTQLIRHGIPVTVVPCSSIRPLPVHQVANAAAQLIVCLDASLSNRGIGGCWQDLHPALDLTYCGAESHLGTAPQPMDVLYLIRMQLGL